MNAWDIVLIAVIAAAVAGAVIGFVRAGRRPGCGCGCEGCANEACSARRGGGAREG